MKNYSKDVTQSGFTLVELMITIFISSLLTVAFYGTYILQRTSYAAQGQVAEMQQNVRAGIASMTMDLRLAGYDPEGIVFAAPANVITAARQDLFAFMGDMDGSGALGTVGTPATESEYFAYDLYTAANGISTLGRTTSRTAPIVVTVSGSHYEATGHQPVADNIERLEFAYYLNDGTVVGDATASGDHDNIRAVRISILARAKSSDSKYTDTQSYTTALGTVWPASNDGFRRRLIITQIDLRNMGL